MGVRAANKAHRYTINCVLVFIAWNLYSFVRNYNNYWRLRRDPNIPKQWLEEQNDPATKDWEVDNDRIKRDDRMIGRSGLKDAKYYD